MKRVVATLIASATLLVIFSGVADAAAPSSSSPAQCHGPANYCNVFFGR